jgi:hypothetical protein
LPVSRDAGIDGRQFGCGLFNGSRESDEITNEIEDLDPKKRRSIEPIQVVTEEVFNKGSVPELNLVATAELERVNQRLTDVLEHPGFAMCYGFIMCRPTWEEARNQAITRTILDPEGRVGSEYRDKERREVTRRVYEAQQT